MTTRHLIDSAEVDGPALSERHEARRLADLELSDRLAAEIEHALTHSEG